MARRGRRAKLRTGWLVATGVAVVSGCGETDRDHKQAPPSGTDTASTSVGGSESTSAGGTTSTEGSGGSMSHAGSGGGGSAGADSGSGSGWGGEAGAMGCACLVDRHCATDTCIDGWCDPPRCEDGVQNGSETEVDCGGPACLACVPQISCVSGDCGDDGLCVCGLCEPGPPAGEPSCRDGIHNGDETKVDCGGPVCPACSEPWCCWDSECSSGVCHENRCQPAACDDAVQNASESDIDCGGPECEPCPVDRKCTRDADCDSGSCDEALARPEECGSVRVCIP